MVERLYESVTSGLLSVTVGSRLNRDCGFSCFFCSVLVRSDALAVRGSAVSLVNYVISASPSPCVFS